jgi:subfamily B ATP-binding cassette protein MsbA
MKEVRTLLAFALPYRGRLALGAGLMVAESALALAVPWLGGKLAAVFIQTPTGDGMTPQTLFLAMLAVLAAQALLKYGNIDLLGGTADRLAADLKIRLYDHLQALPLGFFHQRRQGDALALLTHDVYVVSGYLGGAALGVVPLLLTVGGALVCMFRIQGSLALLALILTPLFYLLIKICGRRMRPLARELQEEHARAIAIAQENLGMLPAIKTFTREEEESERYRNQIEQVVRLSARERRLNAALGPGIQLLAAAAIVLVLWLAQGAIHHGSLAPSQLVSFLLYGQLMTRPMAGLADLYGQTQRARGALGRLAEVLAEEPEPSWDQGKPMPSIRGGIEFWGVTFAYPGRAPALKRLDLRIAPGETIAITGPNGAGKSTIGHLILRLHEPSEGGIFIDGVDITTVSLRSLRGQIGIVPQHVLLFNATVRDNIAYGRPEPTQEEVEAAAKAARAHDFILQLPQGYDTWIGDRGVRLSGGQQQRLALARALLKDPPILILDEATAMFDPEGEREFLKECRELLRRRTVLLITHRPASLELADRVLRLKDGAMAGADEEDGVTVPVA